MKFLRTDTSDLQLCEISGLELFDTRYAILSHTWEDDEVLLADIGKPEVVSKKGYRKVNSARNLAYSHGFEYIWIDTCCIDKNSSAELSEAINSMYHWYENASVCYAYLFDVDQVISDFTGLNTEFPRSRWFTRGWTLQELIAPLQVWFYSRTWEVIGSKGQLHEHISSITGVDSSILLGKVKVTDASVARRMSWAASRETSRTEDRAYSLMGIFEVNMPLIYGEGTDAFLRLQEELLKHNIDESLFAWGLNTLYPPLRMIATHPGEFARSHDVLSYQADKGSKSFSFTKEGVSMTVGLQHIGDSTYQATLNCIDLSDMDGNDYVIFFLQKSAGTNNEYIRCKPPPPHCYASTSVRGKLEYVFIRQNEARYAKHGVVLLRRGPMLRQNHDGFKLLSMRTFECSHTEQEPVPRIQSADKFIRRSKTVADEWIPKGMSCRLDVCPSKVRLWAVFKAWSLIFVQEATNFLLQVDIIFQHGGLRMSAGVKDLDADRRFRIVSKSPEHRFWTVDANVESLVDIKKVYIPGCEFYILDFNIDQRVVAWLKAGQRRPWYPIGTSDSEWPDAGVQKKVRVKVSAAAVYELEGTTLRFELPTEKEASDPVRVEQADLARVEHEAAQMREYLHRMLRCIQMKRELDEFEEQMKGSKQNITVAINTSPECSEHIGHLHNTDLRNVKSVPDLAKHIMEVEEKGYAST